MSSLAVILSCACNPKHTYASRSTFEKHKHSKRHAAFLGQLEVRNVRVKLAQAEKTIAQLQEEIAWLRTPAGRRRKTIPMSLRRQVAHAQDYQCAKCECKLPPTWETDHVLPIWRGGTNAVANLQALCPNCHRYKTTYED